MKSANAALRNHRSVCFLEVGSRVTSSMVCRASSRFTKNKGRCKVSLMSSYRLLCFVMLWTGILSVFAAPVAKRVEVSRDLWISAVGKEGEGNNGASPKLKLKGIQEFFLIDFDPAQLKGQRVVRAQLHLHCESAENLGRVTVSTVTDEWVEGQGNGYAKTVGSSSFLWARTGEKRWSGDGPDITGVVLGQGGSQWGFGDASPRSNDDWITIPIEPAVVQARIDGRSQGFFVIDDVGNEYTREGNTINYRQFPNRFFSSRDSNKARAPYFTLWLEPASGNVAPQSIAPPVVAVKPKAVLPPMPKLPVYKRIPLPVSCRSLYGESLPAVDLYAARGEAVGFLIESGTDVVEVKSPADVEVSLFAAGQVGGVVDPLIPQAMSNLREAANTIRGGTFVEIYVRKNAKPGEKEITVSVGGKTFPVSLTVWNFTLADRLAFIPQMNCYSLPKDELDYYRLAHEHRTTLNCLRYGWTGKVDKDAVPQRKGNSAWDWTAWDAKFGPLMDGSAFRGLRRDGVPIEAIYLPLNENWPMELEKHFRGGYWVENAFDDAYWQEFRTIAGEFAGHFAAKGWKEPLFEFYLNNKVYFKRDRGNRWDACSAPWIFDEPVNTQDFWALRRYGLEFWRGVSSHPGARFTVRADISRPEWQRDLLDGVTSVEVVSGALRPYRERVISRAEKFDNLVYMYGSANNIGTPNVMPAAWCVETWALGGDGVVPWQTIGKAAAWKTPDQLSLFYPTATGPVPSIRLKAFRAGQQLVEYLTMYQALTGQDRTALGNTVLAEPGLIAKLEKKSETDAGTSKFDSASAKTLEELRLRLGFWLDAKAPAPRDRWADPRPAPRNGENAPERMPVKLGQN